MKKQFVWIAMVLVTGSLLAACSDNSKEGTKEPTEHEKAVVTKNDSATHQKETEEKQETSTQEKATPPENESTKSEETNEQDAKDSTTNKEEPQQEKSVLASYSAKEIEYARVWLQVVGNKETQSLNVSTVAAGQLVNPYEEQESATYPQNVIYLSGQSMADGGVTYSGNGDGTINVYDVPSHWQSGVLPEGKTMKEYTTEIVTNPKRVSVQRGNDQDVVDLIKKLHME